ncbi:MAG: hypothetical protein MZW92_46670 [Comamonadaceae bacterium]|nr:hypothetical protein [Comamonadaceae bacterium]
MHKQSRTAAVKWLAEIMHSNPAWMNPVTAKKLGVKTGDLVRIETKVGYLVTKAYVTEGIHPKVVSIPTAFGHWEYGRLATLKLKEKPALRRRGGPGPEQRLVGRQGRASRTPSSRWWPIPSAARRAGSTRWSRSPRPGPNDKYGDVQGDWQKHVEAFKETPALRLHRRPAPQDAPGDGGLGRAGERQAEGGHGGGH